MPSRLDDDGYNEDLDQAETDSVDDQVAPKKSGLWAHVNVTSKPKAKVTTWNCKLCFQRFTGSVTRIE